MQTSDTHGIIASFILSVLNGLLHSAANVLTAVDANYFIAVRRIV